MSWGDFPFGTSVSFNPVSFALFGKKNHTLLSCRTESFGISEVRNGRKGKKVECCTGKWN